MFTGIVEEIGVITDVGSREDEDHACRLVVVGPKVSVDVSVGDSIAVAGCCLTVVCCEGQRITFDVGAETLGRTTLGFLRIGDRVNLERSLSVGDRLGGHFVTGHIDGIGTLAERTDAGEWSAMRFVCDRSLTTQMASKGSIAVDGVSLTLVDVGEGFFSVALIPHTLSVTTLGMLKVGAMTNLETDVLAKYVQRQLGVVTRSPNH